MEQPRNFLAFVESLPPPTKQVAALDKVNAKRLALKFKSDLECFANAGLFGDINETQKLVESYFSKLMKSRKIHDFVVVNSTRPIDLERNNFKLDIAIKPTPSVNFIHLPMQVGRVGVLM